MFIEKTDPQIAKIIRDELKRQRNGLEMIASENLVSPAVMEATGSVLTNKYAEGYPGKRYYAGNEFIDEAETLAILRAKKLFGAEHANVQPHSGSQANAAAYFALLNPGDKILAMDLAHGGHLTHGAKVNFSGKFYQVYFYGVDKKTGLIDMKEVRRLAKKIRPKLIVTGASAYPRQIDFRAFKKIADETGAYLLADIAHIAGLVAAGLHPDPVPYCDVVTTTTHKTLRGPRGAIILCKKEDHLRKKYHPSPLLGKEGTKGRLPRNLAQMIDAAVFPGIQGGPLEHIIAAKAVALKEALRPSFKKYQRQVVKNAQVLAAALISGGLKLVSGGTDNHLILINLAETGLSGREAETLLEKAGIYANKNMIPYDPRPPFDPSGLRLGTPALTTRGLKEKEMKIIGGLIANLIRQPKNPNILKEAKQTVRKLVKKFTLYPEIK